MTKFMEVGDKGMVTEDGQVLNSKDYTFIAVPKNACKLQGFFMGFQHGFIALAKDPEIAGVARRILDYLLGIMDWENFIGIEQKVIAEELKLDKTQVSRAIKLLVTKEILEVGPSLGRNKSYKLNLYYGWKGKSSKFKAKKDKQFKEALNRFTETKAVEAKKPKKSKKADLKLIK